MVRIRFPPAASLQTFGSAAWERSRVPFCYAEAAKYLHPQLELQIPKGSLSPPRSYYTPGPNHCQVSLIDMLPFFVIDRRHT
jgi:hypothetical protein